MSAAGIYDPAFIAANQEARADNIIKGSKQQQVGTRDSRRWCQHQHHGGLDRQQHQFRQQPRELRRQQLSKDS
jgi:hypothetical protein